MAGTSSTNPAIRALQLELKKIHEEPVEGFRVSLPNEDNLFEWQVAIFGPPGTLYEGGYFKVIFFTVKDLRVFELPIENIMENWPFGLCSHKKILHNDLQIFLTKFIPALIFQCFELNIV